MKKVIIFFLQFVLMVSCSSAGKTASAKVMKVYINAYGNTILIDTPDKQGEILIEDKGSVFQIIETTKDNQWAIVIQMTAEAGEGRVETVYLLFNTFLKMKINSGLYNGETLLGFEDTAKGSFVITGDNKKIDLKMIYQRMHVP